ncbi:molybdate ABC transporter substrate-binding protein [Lysinibacillus louembei]|uniref:Molybdate ABC transporter substrate-binding protein n=1 Tax=Lysinibacillus louembei TaxID=1470088 RepID=A0ABZ0RY20_9BACI|nr:molybdate ABC transporter substrate-binding protein [Lysinibacillus louembei]WPK12172.1 molybdate ABC transporter substrate-binding protein [Lysinibacillus louembei]
MKKIYCIAILFVSILLVGCSSQTANDEAVELTISAAASLQDALEELTATYTNEHPNVTITYNFGGSGTLQQQILQGAPVDLFFSAAENKFDELVDEGFIDQKQGTKLLANELVLVVPANNTKNIQSFKELKNAEKIALGTPDNVPAGQYGMEVLQNLELWHELEAKVVYTKDVRQVLTYVETENVDAGLVYKTDALISDKVEIVATAASDTHTPIIYPVGILKDSKQTTDATDFYEFLQSDAAMEIFEKYGFNKGQ